MIYAVGSYNKIRGSYSMFGAGDNEYKSTTYIGYTLKGMQKKWREDNNCKGKHVEWIISGLEYIGY